MTGSFTFSTGHSQSETRRENQRISTAKHPDSTSSLPLLSQQGYLLGEHDQVSEGKGPEKIPGRTVESKSARTNAYYPAHNVQRRGY